MVATKIQTRFREKMKRQGYKQQSFWISTEEDEMIRQVMKRDGLETRADVIRYALRNFANQDNKMRT